MCKCRKTQKNRCAGPPGTRPAHRRHTGGFAQKMGKSEPQRPRFEPEIDWDAIDRAMEQAGWVKMTPNSPDPNQGTEKG